MAVKAHLAAFSEFSRHKLVEQGAMNRSSKNRRALIAEPDQFRRMQSGESRKRVGEIL
jgi:hypothetical protein